MKRFSPDFLGGPAELGPRMLWNLRESHCHITATMAFSENDLRKGTAVIVIQWQDQKNTRLTYLPMLSSDHSLA